LFWGMIEEGIIYIEGLGWITLDLCIYVWVFACVLGLGCIWIPSMGGYLRYKNMVHRIEV
jgi:hypothetical protein